MSKLYQDYSEVLLPRDLKCERIAESEKWENPCPHVLFVRGLNPGGEAGCHHVAAPDGLDLLHQAKLWLGQQLEKFKL